MVRLSPLFVQILRDDETAELRDPDLVPGAHQNFQVPAGQETPGDHDPQG